MRAVVTAFVCPRFQEVCGRHDLQSISSADWYVLHFARSAVPKADRAVLDLINTGSLWYSKLGFKAGYEDENRCPHCGGATVPGHLQWDCPSFQAIRDKFPLAASIDHNNIPAQLRCCAVPPVCTAHSTLPLWGGPAGTVQDAGAELPDTPRKARERAARLDEVSARLGCKGDLDACAFMIKGSYPLPDLEPLACVAAVPVTPTCLH